MWLNASITLLFIVIVVFQPWIAVIFLFFWLLEKKQKEIQQENYNHLVDRIDAIFEEPVQEEKKPAKQKPTLRIVK